MPTILSHPAVPLALGIGLPPRLLVAGVLASVVPDLDVLAFRLGVPYDASWGHRGATHSIAFALLLGLVALLFASRVLARRSVAFSFVALAAASHGLLDMLTNGGRGVALFWPVTTERFFFPSRMIEVSPLSLRRLLDGRGLEVLQSELLWIWLPAGLGCAVLLLCRPLFDD